ncbi:NAD-binding protein [Halalkalicoccus sp. NIPERK01]|uniref:NAD-binding protein n=1 Tax=Halalkalicoccus sp. NIPERK01 TaxID=3053469 RepID=UPI00256F57FB|nr:NAD-binding protein [Halalkalicoccus sp. NIPERK01]
MIEGERTEIDPKTMVEIFNENTGQNAVTEGKFLAYIIPGRSELGFTLALIHKDMRLFSRLADNNDAPVLLRDTVRNLGGYAKKKFGDDADMAPSMSSSRDEWIRRTKFRLSRPAVDNPATTAVCSRTSHSRRDRRLGRQRLSTRRAAGTL